MTKPVKIYAEFVEQAAMDQFNAAMAHPNVVQGALMPDAHAGYTLPIGSVVAVKDMVFPSFIGYDVGCGVAAVQTTFSEVDIRDNAKAIFNQIYVDIPTGFRHNLEDTPWSGVDLPRSNVAQEIFTKNGLKQLGSLGGGNHFIEIGVDETGLVWFIVHSGSRGIGHSIASHYMKMASGTDKPKEGLFGLGVGSLEGRNYILDLNFCLAFALENRKEMLRRVNAVVQGYCTGEALFNTLINRNHNHAELSADGLWIHRKGATHAEEGMMGVIPGNMRDGCFIVRGKGNKESMCSSSHGAGRVMGRKEALRKLNLEDFAKTMSNVTASVTEETLDESPFAYKDIFEVMKQQEDLVKVVAHVRPLINIKG